MGGRVGKIANSKAMAVTLQLHIDNGDDVVSGQTCEAAIVPEEDLLGTAISRGCKNPPNGGDATAPPVRGGNALDGEEVTVIVRPHSPSIQLERDGTDRR